MKHHLLIPLLATAALASACGGSGLKWQRVDGGSVDEARLQEAMKTCRVQTKLTALERAAEESNNDVSKAPSNEAKMLLKDEFQQLRAQVYREIDTCMTRQGYRR